MEGKGGKGKGRGRKGLKFPDEKCLPLRPGELCQPTGSLRRVRAVLPPRDVATAARHHRGTSLRLPAGQLPGPFPWVPPTAAVTTRGEGATRATGAVPGWLAQGKTGGSGERDKRRGMGWLRDGAEKLPRRRGEQPGAPRPWDRQGGRWGSAGPGGQQGDALRGSLVAAEQKCPEGIRLFIYWVS